jgi:Protein of unknown function (DUF2809)
MQRSIFFSLLIIIPLGIYTKFYTGIGKAWVKDYAGDVLYEICWCLLVFFFIPKIKRKQVIAPIAIWVFVITCCLEILQLWQPPILNLVRSTFIGKLVLGTTFVWWDFPHYLLGSFLGYFWLYAIDKLSIRNPKALR